MARRKQSHDAAALLLVAGVFVIAAIGVYLLAIAAVALVGWLVRLATKRAPVLAGEPERAAPLPVHAEYHSIIPVEPASFANPEDLRTAARHVFNAWVATFPSAPGDASDLVRAVTSQPRLIGRLTTELEGRRFVWRASPKTGRAALGGPPLDPNRLDPWNPPDQLRARSTYFASCWTCGGDGKVSCVPCGGAGRRTCSSCSGSGKYYGVTANGAQRMLNCKECRGKGSVSCQACTRGAVECSTCQKAKRLECWLEIDESSRQDVQVEPDGAMTKAFAWGQDGVRASSADIARDAKVVDSVTHSRSIALSDVPAAVPDGWREHYWSRIQAQIQPGERIRSQTFTLLEVPATTVAFAVGSDVHDVTFEGLRMLAPPANVGSPFAARARALKRLKLVLATLPITALVIYLARGSYFVTERTGPLVAAIVGSAVLVGVCAYAVVWYSTVGRRVARRWAAAAIAPLAVACVCAVLVEPSVARAREQVAAGHLDKARFELEALGSPSDPELAPVWSDLLLADSLASTTCTIATQRLATIALPAQRAKAQGHADALAVAAAQAALDQGHADDAKSLLLCASDASRGTPAAKTLGSRIALSSAGSCSITKDWDCVFRYT
ncbi:MAG: hypothetical protein JWP01_3450, partial [Myxococcales bacterium]|nr:hypothetical protein [Myxococcales bacterium]